MSVGLSPWGATARLSWQDCPSDLPPFPATQAVGQGPERRVKWRMSQGGFVIGADRELWLQPLTLHPVAGLGSRVWAPASRGRCGGHTGRRKVSAHPSASPTGPSGRAANKHLSLVAWTLKVLLDRASLCDASPPARGGLSGSSTSPHPPEVGSPPSSPPLVLSLPHPAKSHSAATTSQRLP